MGSWLTPTKGWTIDDRIIALRVARAMLRHSPEKISRRREGERVLFIIADIQQQDIFDYYVMSRRTRVGILRRAADNSTMEVTVDRNPLALWHDNCTHGPSHSASSMFIVKQDDGNCNAIIQCARCGRQGLLPHSTTYGEMVTVEEAH